MNQRKSTFVLIFIISTFILIKNDIRAHPGAMVGEDRSLTFGLNKSDTARLSDLPLALQYAASEAMGRQQNVYHFERIADGFRGATPSQDYTAFFDGKGFTLTSGSSQLRIQLTGIGYGDRTISAPPTLPVIRDNRIEFRRGNVTEWYVNGPMGLQQGFTLHDRPELEDYNNTHLKLILALSSGWHAEVSGSGRDMQLTSDGTALTYGGLMAYDATGKDLPAHFAVHPKSSTLAIIIDDASAVYPLTIDPFIQQAYLKASNAEMGDSFGFSVAISGNYAVVGAIGEDSNDAGDEDNNSASSAGAAYVFVRSGTAWTQQAYLKASNAEAGDSFGYSVSIDGDYVVVGAYGEDSNGTGGQGDNSADGAGAAYVFVRSGTTWAQQAYLKASNAGADDKFGISVAINGDYTVVGAWGEASNGAGGQGDNSASSAGAAYVFVRSGTAWTQQAYLKASNAGADDKFGWSVAIHGDGVVVGAHGEASNGTGGQGDNSAANAGAAYVFVRSGTTWTQQAYLKASNAEAGDSFGYSVGVDGNYAVISARGEDSNGTGGEGDNSANNAGAAYVFVRSGTVWTQQAYLKASNAGSGDSFGYRVAINWDYVVIGARYEASNGTDDQGDNSAYGAGAAYVFVRIGTAWTQQAYLKASNAEKDDVFGISVAIDGDYAVIGAWGEDSNGIGGEGDNSAANAGAAYVFGPFGVTSTNPAGGTHSAAVSTNISATFNADIDAATVSDATFVAHRGFRGGIRSTDHEWSASTSTATLDPPSDFHPGEQVQVTSTRAITYSDGSKHARPHVWQFRTAVSEGLGYFGAAAFDTFGGGVSTSFALGDVDGDGDLDACIANFSQAQEVWLNQGGAQGGTAGDYGAAAFDTFGAGYSKAVALGDVDGDGDLDACIANYNQAQEVWLNQGGAQGGTAGDFGAAAFDTFGGGHSESVTLGDVDGDGDLDACIANYNQAQEVWLNQGGAQGGTAGDFGTAAFDTFGGGHSESVTLGDVDGDGDLDVCIANYNQAQEVWLNQGGGNFGAAAFDTFGAGYSYSVALGDVDGDGDLDACIANIGDQAQEVWLNQGGAQGGTVGDYGAAAFDTFGAGDSFSIALGDVDGDGDLDACIANDNEREVWLNQGGAQDGTAGDYGEAAFDTFGGGSSTSIALGDVDGDGDLDVCIANSAGQAQEVWLNSPLDFGDAPDPLIATAGEYPTLLVNNGARHLLVDNNPILGAVADIETDGQSSAASDGDDNDGTDDDDGVTNLSQLVLYKGVVPEIDLALVNTTGSTATIKGWIDYNRNGIFEDNESAITTVANGATSVTLTFPTVPQTAPKATYARFRIATNGAEIANPTGMAGDGEVEDYPVSIGGVQVVLVSPVGDEWLRGGSSQRIEWYTIPPGVGTIDLYCSFDGGQNYHDVIGTSLPNVGFHVWEVPAVNNQFCRVKIDVIGSLLATTTSARNFTIDSTPPNVNMTNPTSGQTWSGGLSYDITWDATDNFGFGAQAGESTASKEGAPDQTFGSGPISIQYSFDNWTTDKYYTIAECELNDGHFAWIVPMNLVGSTIQIKVRAVDQAGNVGCGHHTGDIVIVAPPAPIALTAPNGGETFAAGSSQKITWTSNASDGKVDLYYSMDSGDTYPYVIAQDEVNDGSYDWTVPDINTQSLRIKAVLSGPVDQEDVSDQDLTVDGLAPTVELTSPSSALTIEAGGYVDITWTAQDNFDLQNKPISLFYSTDGGSTFPNPIVQSVENDGKYTWNVPTDLNSSKVRVRIEAIDKAGLKASSSSKQNMTIAPLTLALTYPNGGEVLAGGETKTITWASTLSEGTVTLRYTTDGGKTWPHTIATNEENDGAFDWTLPGLNSQKVSLKITLESAQVHEDHSNGTFTIDSTLPTVVLQSFTGGDSVEAGGRYEIRWKAEDNFGLKENGIALRYSDDGGLTYPHTIAEDLEDRSTFTWTTPKHLKTDKVRLKIETQDEAGHANSNVSPSSFTVMPLIITVTQPNGGELWNGMTLQTIQWTSNFNAGFVTLKYSTNGGQTWPHTIASGLDNEVRKYDWEVPQINAENVRVKAELSLQNQTFDVSNDKFQIQHHAPEVTIIYPIGGETWEANSTNEIRWTAKDAHFDLKDNPINILFSKDGGQTFNDSIAVKIKNDSLLYWTTPRDLNSSDVRIKVEAVNVREVKGYDVIDENMVVLNPPPVISSIPDITFDNTGAAYFDLNPYVSDNNDRLIDLTWSGWCEEPKIEIIINNENKWCTIIAREITGLFDVILTATDPWGDSASDTLQIEVSGPTSVETPVIASGPTEFVLEQNVPNPFNPQTTLRYGLPEDTEVRILVFNMTGKQVAELYNGHQSKGYHTVTWHALDQPTGVYFIRMMAGDFHEMKKCILMK